MLLAYRVCIEATTEEGPFFQNVYPFAKSETDALDMVMKLVEIWAYDDVMIDDVFEIDGMLLEDQDLEMIEGFNGYIDPVQYGYSEEDDNN